MTPTAPSLFRVEALCRATATRPDLVRRLAKAAVVPCAGRTATKQPLFAVAALTRLGRVRELLNAGYLEKDVATVLGPATRRPDDTGRVFMTLAELCPKTQTPEREYARALTLGCFAPDGIRDDDEPLFLATRRDQLARILDLLHLGLEELAQAAAKVTRLGPLPSALAADMRDKALSRRHAATRIIRTLDRSDRGRAPHD